MQNFAYSIARVCSQFKSIVLWKMSSSERSLLIFSNLVKIDFLDLILFAGYADSGKLMPSLTVIDNRLTNPSTPMNNYNSFDALASSQSQPLHSDMSVFNTASYAYLNSFATTIERLYNDLVTVYEQMDFEGLGGLEADAVKAIETLNHLRIKARGAVNKADKPSNY